ncbi:MAG: YkgJ family cysteine cluster protein [Peptococcaceae bacterium]|nr:YkgJ family cysteine cluster protein [Peptococcaceae bacterium]
MADYMGPESTFKFKCDPGYACFNQCCRDINIYLTPYDVLRMRRKLKISSQEFLDNHTIRTSSKTGFPVVLLKMNAKNNFRCPFVSEEKGCLIYDERPWSCRMAPLDIKGRDKYEIAFDPSNCLGIGEGREWTVQQWMADQKLDEYEDIEADFKKIPARIKFTGFQSLDRHIAEMVYMTCYNIDKFRKYVFKTGFSKAFNIPQEELEPLKTDDIALLKFGLKWLSESFDIKKSMELRDQLNQTG